jgi:Ca2+/Na+ antiporter
MAKFSRKNYFKPTSKKLRVIGDTLLATFGGYGVASIFEAISETDKNLRKTKMIISGVSVLLGILGKFLTNFTKKEDVIQPTETSNE